MDVPTIAYGSSLRAAPVERTLQRARDFGGGLGITRVTDVTRLDRIGIPVCVGIRPDAAPGSLCVHAGKGVTPVEAATGAWMEAIEFALAEPGVSPVETVLATARDVLNGRERTGSILDLCPVLHANIALDEPLTCVAAEDLGDGDGCLLPAEVVFIPPPENHVGGGWFGTSSSGLASGNSALEATTHALAEVIEHDIEAFRLVQDTSHPILQESLPAIAADLCARVRAAGLRLSLYYQTNAFDLAYVMALLSDPECDSGLYVNGGYGCHPHSAIAVVRAICEAAQSRLAYIHGGRDDLAVWVSSGGAQARSGKEGSCNPRDAVAPIPFDAIPDHSQSACTLSRCYDLLVDRLRTQGLHRICRVTFTRPDDPLHVVKIVVPGLEEFHRNSRRVGRRLVRFIEGLDPGE